MTTIEMDPSAKPEYWYQKHGIRMLREVEDIESVACAQQYLIDEFGEAIKPFDFTNALPELTIINRRESAKARLRADTIGVIGRAEIVDRLREDMPETTFQKRRVASKHFRIFGYSHANGSRHLFVAVKFGVDQELASERGHATKIINNTIGGSYRWARGFTHLPVAELRDPLLVEQVAAFRSPKAIKVTFSPAEAFAKRAGR